jgi:hypothetical protein
MPLRSGVLFFYIPSRYVDVIFSASEKEETNECEAIQLIKPFIPVFFWIASFLAMTGLRPVRIFRERYVVLRVFFV